jgi:1-acyl-sn-glycerol-3-phosphate acyltransferase
MKKIVAYPFTVIYYTAFLLCLWVFHVLQVIGFTLGGQKAQGKAANALTFFLLRCLNLLGTRITIYNKPKLPKNRPIILVSNHQSTYDIPPLHWYFRNHKPRFVSKIELQSGIPSISYNLRKGGSALIDRKNPEQALNAITEFAKNVAKDNACAILFPEGTRSKNGQPRRFQRKGLRTLIEHLPNALVVPVTINNSWKLSRYNYFPMPLGVHLTLTVHPPIAADALAVEELIDQLENTVHQAVIASS